MTVAKQDLLEPASGAHVHHHTHPDIVKRLRRAEGFLRFALSEEGRALYRDCGYLPPEAGAADGTEPAGGPSP